MSESAAPSLKQDLDSLCDHDKRILVRAIVAPKWEIFIPQPNQQWTKAAVRDKTAQVLAYMASFVPTALENKEPLDDSNYRRVLIRVRNEPADRQRLAIYLIAEHFKLAYGRGKDDFCVYDHALRLGQLMLSMEIEHQANVAGWLYTGERVDPVKRARHEAHQRVGGRRVR